MARSTAQTLQSAPNGGRDTQVLSVNPSKIGEFVFSDHRASYLEDWDFKLSGTIDGAHLLAAATMLRSSNVPIAFPTETVYGLGADATRTSAVIGIYAAKQRPADNPLIVHFSSLTQLKTLLGKSEAHSSITIEASMDPIPSIYHSVISRFWPGPLTILLPLPTPCLLAPQVSASLSTFGARMPSSPLALALIHLAGVPLAAPSANASTKPSPTTAAHVLEDLSGRIDLILDGGPCNVGVESTVVDGLTDPPVILRPGGISIEMLRQCPGWEGVKLGYKDRSEELPRAPGMKYRHYSPRARVVLVEGPLEMELIKKFARNSKSFGIIRTKTWTKDIIKGNGIDAMATGPAVANSDEIRTDGTTIMSAGQVPEGKLVGDRLRPSTILPSSASHAYHTQIHINEHFDDLLTDVWNIGLGGDAAGIARGLFSALRDLDQKGVAVMFVEGISDSEGDTAAAVMNRLRKAAGTETKA